jgi:hypothetical protein
MPPLSPAIQAVLDLFQGPLAAVRFADIDASTLATAAEEVESAGAAVAAQEAQLAQLQQGLNEQQEALLLLAQRALAYARVYAEHDEALSEQLNRISLPRAPKPRKASAPKATESEAAAPEHAAAEAPDATAGAPDHGVSANASDASDETEAAPAPVVRKGKRRVSSAAAQEAAR